MKSYKTTLTTNNQINTNCKIIEHWLLHKPIGREILKKERIFYLSNVKDAFGKYSLQIGLDKINLLQGNKIVNYYKINDHIINNLDFMPFASDSIDLIVCSHVLEFYPDYNVILQELYRILSPNGKIILTCFNSNSWISLFKKRIPAFKYINLINLDAIKKSLFDLNFQIEGGKFFCYCPPFRSQAKLTKYNWLNKVGDRWFPTFSNSFALILNKRVITANVIRAKNLDQTKYGSNVGAAATCNKN